MVLHICAVVQLLTRKIFPGSHVSKILSRLVLRNLSMGSDEEQDLTTQALEMFFSHPDIHSRLWKPLRLHMTYYLTCTAIIHMITITILIIILWKIMRSSSWMPG